MTDPEPEREEARSVHLQEKDGKKAERFPGSTLRNEGVSLHRVQIRRERCDADDTQIFTVAVKIMESENVLSLPSVNAPISVELRWSRNRMSRG